MPKEEPTCTICVCPIEDDDPKYSCSEQICQILICEDCIDALLDYSKNNNLLPSCPSNDCHGLFIFSGLRSLPKQSQLKYQHACLNHFMKAEGDNVQKRIEQAKIIEKLRDDRIKFLEAQFPKGIALVSKLAFKDKLKRLDKQKKAIIDTKLKNANKACLNLTCKGFLDPDFTCMTCQTIFCKQCEKKLTKNHACKQEDLDSVNLINNMVHCPGCKLPVFKNVGCDSITCANCNTNFLYSTGKIGGHGSSNAKVNIKIAQKQNLSSSLVHLISPDCMVLLLNIEAREPKFVSKDILLTPLREYIKTGEKDSASKNLAKSLDKYTRYQISMRKYTKMLTEIEQMLLEKKEEQMIKTKLAEILNELD